MWVWKVFNEAGETLTLPDDLAEELTFHSQADAESWIGESFQDLIDAGVDKVELFEDDTLVYPMSLHPAS